MRNKRSKTKKEELKKKKTMVRRTPEDLRKEFYRLIDCIYERLLEYESSPNEVQDFINNSTDLCKLVLDEYFEDKKKKKWIKKDSILKRLNIGKETLFYDTTHGINRGFSYNIIRNMSNSNVLLNSYNGYMLLCLTEFNGHSISYIPNINTIEPKRISIDKWENMDVVKYPDNTSMTRKEFIRELRNRESSHWDDFISGELNELSKTNLIDIDLNGVKAQITESAKTPPYIKYAMRL